MNLSRRNFLSLTLTSGLIALYNNKVFANSSFGTQKKKVLILIEMRGGNDGVNTAPMSYQDIYNSTIKAIRGDLDEGYTPGANGPNNIVSSDIDTLIKFIFARLVF